MFFLWGGRGGRGGAGVLVACLPFYFSLFSAPIPPTPFPGGEGGDLRLFYARGFAPCIPGAGRGAALAEPAVQETEGGRKGVVACLPCHCGTRRGAQGFWLPADLAFSLLSCPHPPSPLPLRGRGSPKVYFAGGSAPGSPATGWDAALAQLSVTRIESPAFCHRCKGFWLSLSMSSAVSQGEGGPGERNFGV